MTNKLNKTEAKMMSRMTPNGVASYDGKREFNAACSLRDKGLVEIIPSPRDRVYNRGRMVPQGPNGAVRLIAPESEGA